jgi:two-component system OmpR family sensor kinase
MEGDGTIRRPPVTLRLRLVVAVVVLLTAGFVLFGVVTTSAYSKVQRDRLDEIARSSVPLMSLQLRQTAGFPVSPREAGGVGRAGTSVVVPPGTYGELRDGLGNLVGSPVQIQTDVAQPRLPADLVLPASGSRLLDVGSVSGDTSWRVLATRDREGLVVVVAVPLTEVEDATRRLIAIEAATAAGLLVVLGAATWLILRRGLRPLEEMAATASTIAAGDLSPRVALADEHTEVGQLGLALNTMLDGIEGAFHEREVTELRLRQFLADASHELRTPLTSIQGFAELFRLGPDSSQVDLPVIMRRIEQESARMKVLVEDMLLLARLEDTRQPDYAPVDLAVLAADACSDAVAVDAARPLTLDAPRPVVVLGVADHLRQAIANLVTNALRHTPAGTPIEVTAAVDGETAVLTVRDHGGGLDAEALAHAFDRFWRADPSRAGTGAGLGLAIVAGIASEHGGAVAGENAEGGGARFSLRLPAGGAPAASDGGALEDVHAAGRAEADHVGEPDPSALDLPVTGLAPQVMADLPDVRDAGR